MDVRYLKSVYPLPLRRYNTDNMEKPIIFLIDDDQQVLSAISRDIKLRYAKDYKILATTQAREALETLVDLKNESRTVAAFVCDQRMPDMEGIDFLTQAILIYPEAKRILLTAYADTQAAILAINEVQLDYYLMKPWNPPSERLYPILDDLLEDWRAGYRPDFKGIRLVGFQYSPLSHNLKDYLASNLIPYQWLDIEKQELGRTLLKMNGLDMSDLPVVLFENGEILVKPEITDVAQAIGFDTKLSSEIYDVVIIGAGPAGLAAAVYGASEGLKTLLIERKAPGGQAGTSSRIENYLGFPTGLTGADLTRRAISQAKRLGAEFLSPREVSSITKKDNYSLITLSDSVTIPCRSVIITTGVNYRQLETEGINTFTGAGIYYGAATTEATSCRGKEVFIVGGGNSAGQSAVYLSKFASKVTIIIRKDNLNETMSSYLIQQIAALPNISISPNSVILSARGTNYLEFLHIQNLKSGVTEIFQAAALYIFIGAKPLTEWLDDSIERDDKGFIKTGREHMESKSYQHSWSLTRDPFSLETSQPGVFAAGDVRSGAMNRIASAVGEGSMAISFVHKYLSEN